MEEEYRKIGASLSPKRITYDTFDGNVFWLRQVGVSTEFIECYASYLYFDRWFKLYTKNRPAFTLSSIAIGKQKLSLSARLFRDSVWNLTRDEDSHRPFFDTLIRVIDRAKNMGIYIGKSIRKHFPMPTLSIGDDEDKKRMCVFTESKQILMEALVLTCFSFPMHWKNRWKSWHFEVLPEYARRKATPDILSVITSAWYREETEEALLRLSPTPLKSVARALNISLCRLLFPYRALLISDFPLGGIAAQRESEIEHMKSLWITFMDSSFDREKQPKEYQRISNLIQSADMAHERISMMWKPSKVSKDLLKKEGKPNMHTILIFMTTLYTNWMSLPKQSAESSDCIHFAFSSLYLFPWNKIQVSIEEKCSPFITEWEALQYIRANHHRTRSYYGNSMGTDLVSNAGKMSDFIYRYFTEDVENISLVPPSTTNKMDDMDHYPESVMFAMLLNAGITHSNAVNMSCQLDWPPYNCETYGYHHHPKEILLSPSLSSSSPTHIRDICMRKDRGWDFRCNTGPLRKDVWSENLEMIQEHYGILALMHAEKCAFHDDDDGNIQFEGHIMDHRTCVLEFASYATISALLDGIQWFIGTYMFILNVESPKKSSETSSHHSLPKVAKSTFRIRASLRKDNASAITISWRQARERVRCSDACREASDYCARCYENSSIFYGWAIGSLFDISIRLTSFHMNEVRKINHFLDASTWADKKALLRSHSDLPCYAIFGLCLSRSHDTFRAMFTDSNTKIVRNDFDFLDESMGETLRLLFSLEATLVLRTFSAWIQGTHVEKYTNLIRLDSSISYDQLVYGRFLAAATPVLWNLILDTAYADGNADRAFYRLLYFVQMLTIYFADGEQRNWDSHLLFIREPGISEKESIEDNVNNGNNAIVCPTLYEILMTEKVFIDHRKRTNKRKHDMSESTEYGDVYEGNTRTPEVLIDEPPENEKEKEKENEGSVDGNFDSIEEYIENEEEDEMYHPWRFSDIIEEDEEEDDEEDDEEECMEMYCDLRGDDYTGLPQRMYLSHSLWRGILHYCLLNLWGKDQEKFEDVVSELFFYCCPILHVPPSDEYKERVTGNTESMGITRKLIPPQMPEDRLFRDHFAEVNAENGEQVIHGLYIGRGGYNRSEIHPFPFGRASPTFREKQSHYTRFSSSTLEMLRKGGYTWKGILDTDQRSKLNPFVCISMLMEMALYTNDHKAAKSFILNMSMDTIISMDSFALYIEPSLHPYYYTTEGRLQEKSKITKRTFHNTGILTYNEEFKPTIDSIPIQFTPLSKTCDADGKERKKEMVFTTYGECLCIPKCKTIGRGWESMDGVPSSFITDMLFYYGKDKSNRFM